MSDEQWVDWNALDDDAWYDVVQRDFGTDAHRLWLLRFLLAARPPLAASREFAQNWL